MIRVERVLMKNIEDLEAHSKSAHVKAFQASQKAKENVKLTVQCFVPTAL